MPSGVEKKRDRSTNNCILYTYNVYIYIYNTCIYIYIVFVNTYKSCMINLYKFKLSDYLSQSSEAKENWTAQDCSRLFFFQRRSKDPNMEICARASVCNAASQSPRFSVCTMQSPPWMAKRCSKSAKGTPSSTYLQHIMNQQKSIQCGQ